MRSGTANPLNARPIQTNTWQRAPLLQLLSTRADDWAERAVGRSKGSGQTRPIHGQIKAEGETRAKDKDDFVSVYVLSLLFLDSDIWGWICTRLTADTKRCCVPARSPALCVMSAFQYLIWTTCGKLSPITGPRWTRDLKLKAFHSNHVLYANQQHVIMSVCVTVYEGKMNRNKPDKDLFFFLFFYCRKINDLLHEHVVHNRVEKPP